MNLDKIFEDGERKYKDIVVRSWHGGETVIRVEVEEKTDRGEEEKRDRGENE